MSQSKDIALSRVLVATDLEKTSIEALRVGDQWARTTNASLVVVTVLPAGVVATDANARDVATQVEEATKRTPSEYTVLFEQGNPPDAIIARAKELRADLVVVGTHGTKGIQRWLVGSVAQSIVRGSPCPVLIARPSPGGGPVVAGCQLDELTGDVVRWAKLAAGSSSLTLVHAKKLAVSDAALVANAVFTGAVPSTPSKETIESIREMVKGSLEAELTKASARGNVEMVEGAPVHALLERAHELHASLIVVGSHERRGLSRLALGSVAEAVAKNAESSVLVIH